MSLLFVCLYAVNWMMNIMSEILHCLVSIEGYIRFPVLVVAFESGIAGFYCRRGQHLTWIVLSCSAQLSWVEFWVSDWRHSWQGFSFCE